MSPEQLRALKARSPLAWIALNHLVTETGKPFEFTKHRWMIDYLADEHPHKATTKCSQVGWTTLELFDDIHLVGERNLSVIHTMHNSDFLQSFVRPRVNPLIANNPVISKMLTADSEGLKGFNNNFLYFKGANAQSQAISTPADVLKIDEKDKSDPITVEMFQSRLDASEVRWIREFSNPTALGFGIDASWQVSDQRHWFVKCSHCNWEWYIDFEAGDDKRHYVDRQHRDADGKLSPIYACGKCGKALSDMDRIAGRWVAKYPSRDDIHGYWVSQMMAPWFTAKDIVKKFETTSIEFFHNFVLGRAYTPSDLVVDRETILRACAPSQINPTSVAIGVDQKAGELEWVAGSPQGIFAHGKAKSWEQIEHLKLMWQALVVCDPAPYPTMPKRLAEKYDDWYLCYFRETRELDILKWDRQIVYADRTRLLDTVAQEISDSRLIFRERPQQLEDYIADWLNIYRTTVEEPDGRTKSTWLKKENKESDYPFATAYMRVGLARLLSASGGQFIEAHMSGTGIVSDFVRSDGLTDTTLGQAIEDTFAQMD